MFNTSLLIFFNSSSLSVILDTHHQWIHVHILVIVLFVGNVPTKFLVIITKLEIFNMLNSSPILLESTLLVDFHNLNSIPQISSWYFHQIVDLAKNHHLLSSHISYYCWFRKFCRREKMRLYWKQQIWFQILKWWTFICWMVSRCSEKI